MKAALLFLGLLTLTTAQSPLVTAQVDVTASGSASTQTASFKSTGLGGGALTALLPSFGVTANDSTTLSFGLALNPFSGSLNFAGGLSVSAAGSASGSGNIFLNVNFDSSIGGLFTSIANAVAQFLTLSISSTNANPVKITITGTTGSLAASGSAGANVQVGLFTSFTDGTSSASSASSAAVYGAVPYSIAADGKTYTYTIIVPGSGSSIQLNLKPFDANLAKSANNGATAASSGSASFSTAGFIPVALGYDQALTGGLQYAFGNNLQVTPSASSGSQGTLNVQNVGGFSSSSSGSVSGNSAAPSAVNGAANGGVFFNNYYQISGSGSTNILQWSSTPSDATWNTNAFTNVSATVNGFSNSNSITGAALAAQAQAKGQALSWYKSSTSAGASAAANSWTRVSSTSSAAGSGANAGIKVYATVNSYSQWTVASGNGNVVQATFVTFVIALLVILF